MPLDDHATRGATNSAAPAPSPLPGRLSPAPVHAPLHRDLLAGIVASLVALAHCLSFSALIFAGELSVAIPQAVWGFMVATAVVSIWIALQTSLPPVLAGPRNPAVAVMGVLAGVIAAAAAERGLDGAAAARHVLVALSIATVVTGALMLLLGAFRLGQIVRFVPYPVIGGFLGASGLLLIVGGLRVALGPVGMSRVAEGALEIPMLLRLALALAFAALLLAMRKSRYGAASLPLAIVVAVVIVDLWLLAAGSASGWFLDSRGGVAGWSPFAAPAGLDWRVIGHASVEIFSIAAVSVAALMLDVSSLEVQRRGEADMDAEFRNNGAANLAVVAIGGLTVGHALNPSRLIDQLGGTGRVAGLSGGIFIALVLVSGVDVAGLVPRPVLGGLLVFLGAGVLADAVKVPGRRGRPELALTLLIAVAIVGLGYLTGLVLGILGACLLFAARYSRIGIVRRYATRADLAAPVVRDADSSRMLAEDGQRIHVVWLAGYLFFGSSNGLYEALRDRLSRAEGSGRRRWLILDTSAVSGIDAAAILSLQKLENWARDAHVELVIASPPPALEDELVAAGLLGGTRSPRHFSSRNAALEWAEDQLIADLDRTAQPAAQGGALEAWLGEELGPADAVRLVERYLERRDLGPGDTICVLGEPANTIELIASGSVAVRVPGHGSDVLTVRRMTGGTVVGEMGFFRGLPRAASVVADEPAVVYVMSRDAYERLRAEEPALCARFLEFVVRTLSERVEAANREIAVLV